MKKIGITGGIGSGKSVVCNIFRLHDIPVYNADSEAKKLNDTSSTIREKLSQHFGKELYASGKLDKKRLAEFIFNDPQKLMLANSIIHPEVAEHFLNWANRQKNAPIVVLETAILFEADFRKHVDLAVAVVSPLSIRVERIRNRDAMDMDLINSRIKSQMSDQERMKLSDTVIINDSHHSLLQQVSKLLLEQIPS